jgi:hypothetical protein
MTGTQVALFCFYLLLFSFIIQRSKQYKHPMIGKPVFIGIFVLRVLAGIVYGYVYTGRTSDAWGIFNASLLEYKILLTDPAEFMRTTFFFKGNLSLTNFTDGGTSYWNIIKEVLLVKFEAVLDVLSFGNYYVNVVIFCFLIMLGSNAFFRLLERNFSSRSYVNLFSAFLVPSTVFWTSAVYKDGILMALMFVIFWQTQKLLDRQQHLFRYLLITVLALSGLFFLRTYCALLIVPPVAAWIIVRQFNFRLWKVLSVGFLLFLIALALVRWAVPSMDPLQLLASWQHAFLELRANSALPAKPLEPDFRGLLTNLPQAMNAAFLRPLLWENKGLQYLPFAVELFVLQVLTLYVLIKRSTLTTLAASSLVLGLCGLLLIGYTVHIIGAIVRYRSIYMPFLFAAVLSALPLASLSKICRFRRNQ